MSESALYPGFHNPLLGSPRQDLPTHVAIVGAGTIGPDIGYYLKAALPDITLTLMDVAAEPLEASCARYAEYAAKSVNRGKMKPEMAERVLDGIVYTRTTTPSPRPTWSSRRPPRTSPSRRRSSP